MREKILAMEAGRELDALVAEKVMGIKPPKLKGLRFNPPYYSTDISAAWEVVEKFNIAKFNLNYLDGVNFYGEGWHCRIEEEHSHQCKSSPEAICKAALLAVIES